MPQWFDVSRSSSSVAAYIVAVPAVALAAALTFALRELIGPSVSILFFPTVILVAMYGPARGGDMCVAGGEVGRLLVFSACRSRRVDSAAGVSGRGGAVHSRRLEARRDPAVIEAPFRPAVSRSRLVSCLYGSSSNPSSVPPSGTAELCKIVMRRGDRL